MLQLKAEACHKVATILDLFSGEQVWWIASVARSGTVSKRLRCSQRSGGLVRNTLQARSIMEDGWALWDAWCHDMMEERCGCRELACSVYITAHVCVTALSIVTIYEGRKKCGVLRKTGASSKKEVRAVSATFHLLGVLDIRSRKAERKWQE